MLNRFHFSGRRADVILDTDTYNEIDDQFAIAYALKNQDRLNIKGFTCAPFRKATRAKNISEGMAKSYEEVKKILKLSGEEKFFDRICVGCEQFLSDEKTPVRSNAVDFLIETSKKYSRSSPLYILATGAATNIASAILSEPSIVDRICVVWLGGAALNWWHNDEYNMRQDVAAARVLIESAVQFVQIPAQGVTSELLTTGIELEHWLKGKNDICDFLYENSVAYMESRSKFKAWSKVIWDVVVPAFLLDEGGRFMTGRIENRRLPNYGSPSYEKTPLQAEMFYVYQIHRDSLMNDLFEKLRGEQL